jgi:hypothetical protein
MAIHAALRSLDFEYTITSFFRDLTFIRTQTMQKYIIKNAFESSGIWPVNYKARIKKMRSYGKKKRSIEEVEAEDSLDLPPLLPTRPDKVWNTASTLRALADRDPTKFSDNSKETWKITVKKVNVQLQKSHLQTIEHQALQTKLREEYNRKAKSRKSSHKGGPSASVAELRIKIKEKKEKDDGEALRKAKKKLATAINRAKNHLKDTGIQARKDEKARLARIIEYRSKDELIPVEDMAPIREPDKNPMIIERARCEEDFYPDLQLVVRQLTASLSNLAPDRLEAPNTFININEDEDVVINTTERKHQKERVGEYIDSSPPPFIIPDSSDMESNAGSIDSIQANTDFVQF